MDAETERLIQQLARESGCAESDVVREAVHRLAEERIGSRKEDDFASKVRAYERRCSKFQNAYRELAK